MTMRKGVRYFHIYANLCDGRGHVRVTEEPLCESKAVKECERLVKGKTRASKALMVSYRER